MIQHKKLKRKVRGNTGKRKKTKTSNKTKKKYKQTQIKLRETIKS
jgi:hypothetical protein